MNWKTKLLFITVFFVFFSFTVSAECGNGVCDKNESYESCPADCDSPTPDCSIESGIPESGCICYGQEKYDGWCCTGSWQNYECGSVCGNSVCEGGEENTCPGDCVVCGDGKCEGGEDQYSCSADCGSPAPWCGDGTCNENETQDTCPQDCGTPSVCGNSVCETGEEIGCPGDCYTCGDGICNGSETPETCHDDCNSNEIPETCGNNFCDSGETKENCPVDCYESNCGNGICESYNGEDSYNCPVDCETYSECGNQICEEGEEINCPSDCGECGNNFCETGEEINCPGDCFKCGDGICNGSETEFTCHDDCPPSTCGNGTCDEREWEKNCPQDCSVQAECGDGFCDWHLGENPESCSVDCSYEPKCGNRICEQGETAENCQDDCRPGGFCGDGYCGIEENPENCYDDCGAVVKPPINNCPPDEAIQELKNKCEDYDMEFSLRQGHNGCLYGECNTGRKPPQEEDCKEIIEPNGFVRRICENQCFPEPLEIKQRCIESRGTPKQSTDFRGCEITICEYGDSGGRDFIGECSDREKIDDKARECKKQGLKPIIERGFNGCEYVKCAGEFRRDECPVHGFEEIERIRKECNAKGGELIKHFDDRGCGIPQCIMEGDREQYCKDVPREAFNRCEEEGGELIIQKDEQGCVVFETCNRRGDRRFEYDSIEEIPDVTQLLSIALKLEDLKVQLAKVKNKLNLLAEYYKEENDSENAERLEKAASMFGSIEDDIERIKNKIKENADNMNERSVIEIKKEIKLIREKLKDILFVLLGEKETRKDYTKGDCGTDEYCFQKNYAICSPTKYTHIDSYQDNQKFLAEIKGIENGKCIMTVTSEFAGQTLSMRCEDSKYIDSDVGQKMKEICKGPLIDMIKQEDPTGPDYEPEYKKDYQRDYRGDYKGYKEDLGRDIEGCKETFDEQGNKYITCPAKEETKTNPYNPMTGNALIGIKWR